MFLWVPLVEEVLQVLFHLGFTAPVPTRDNITLAIGDSAGEWLDQMHHIKHHRQQPQYFLCEQCVGVKQLAYEVLRRLDEEQPRIDLGDQQTL